MQILAPIKTFSGLAHQIRQKKPKVVFIQPKTEILQEHWQKYRTASKLIDKMDNNVEETLELKQRLWKKMILCYKYNYNLEGQCCFEAFLELSSDGKKFEITSRRPKHEDQMDYELDPAKVKEIRDKEFR